MSITGFTIAYNLIINQNLLCMVEIKAVVQRGKGKHLTAKGQEGTFFGEMEMYT